MAEYTSPYSVEALRKRGLREETGPAPLSWVGPAIRGFLGQEEQGSVMEPGAQEARAMNRVGEGASVLSDLVSLAPAKLLPAMAGIFIGPKAKTWNSQMAAKVSALLNSGHDPETIRQVTGFSRGADGMLRQEIDDSRAALRREPLLGGTPAVPLGQHLQHNELQAAYPEILRDVQMSLRKGPTEGEYQSDLIKVMGPDASDALSTTLHEVQHKIQELEGFARGGSPSEFQSAANWAAKKRGLGNDWAKQKAYADYLRLAGEQESSLTQQRRALSGDERRATPLRYGVPLEKQMVKYY